MNLTIYHARDDGKGSALDISYKVRGQNYEDPAVFLKIVPQTDTKQFNWHGGQTAMLNMQEVSQIIDYNPEKGEMKLMHMNSPKPKIVTLKLLSNGQRKTLYLNIYNNADKTNIGISLNKNEWGLIKKYLNSALHHIFIS